MITRVVEFATRHPSRALAAALSLHVLLWTALPALVSSNLQLDLVEALALGKEWQLGYWKHPPLPWWLADLAYRVIGDVRAVYVLGPLASVAAMYAVWRLGREIVGPLGALIAVLALEGLHFFNFTAVKFNHDVMQLPLWTFTGLFIFRAITRGRSSDWILSGVWLGLAFWTKYSAVILAVPLGLVLLLDPYARRAMRTSGPYVMAATFVVVIGPHLWWLVESDFQPFHHAEARAAAAQHWNQYLTFPVRWIGSQLFFLAPVLGLLAVVLYGAQRAGSCADASNSFARRYVTILAFGPVLLLTTTAALLGRLPISMWGYPLWSFLPLALVVWFPPVLAPRRLRLFVGMSVFVLVAVPMGYSAGELFESYFRDRPKATQFPGRLAAETITRRWRHATGNPLEYVGGAELGSSGGSEFAANNVAVYSPDRPRVLVHGDFTLSPWIDAADFRARGAVLLWEVAKGSETIPANLRETFPRAVMQPPLILPRQTLKQRAPVIVQYAILPPEGDR